MTQTAPQLRGEAGRPMHRHHGGVRSRVQRRGPARCSCPQINAQIIAAAETKNLTLLMATVEEYLKHMNIVNLSTALHRLAKLAAANPALVASLRQNHTLSDMVKAVRNLLWHASEENAAPQCQALSNIVWSFATLQVVDEPVLRCSAELASKHLAGFKQFELASLLWSYAKLVDMRPALHKVCSPLFRQAAEYVKQRLDQFTFRCSVMLLWAYSAVQEHHAELLRSLTTQMMPLPRTIGCNDLVTIASSLSQATGCPETIFADIANKAVCRIHDFKIDELIDLVSAFARARCFHERLFEKALAVVASKSDAPRSLEVQQMLASLALPGKPNTLGEATHPIDLPHSLGRASLPGTHTSGSCAAAVSSGSGGSITASESTDDDFSSQLAPDVMVKNTFVHVADSCYSEKKALLEALLGKPIPPPLEILPHGVSHDALLAFRIDYQMFRAGQAFGARGEVSSNV
mmetsp:Transcript_15078/g.40670  ORF Transcript_15078/g.40670 Transcript_15078/m.40670 type:complete len:462 (-) Transcript_15078:31-1416(-)